MFLNDDLSVGQNLQRVRRAPGEVVALRDIGAFAANLEAGLGWTEMHFIGQFQLSDHRCYLMKRAGKRPHFQAQIDLRVRFQREGAKGRFQGPFWLDGVVRDMSRDTLLPSTH